MLLYLVDTGLFRRASSLWMIVTCADSSPYTLTLRLLGGFACSRYFGTYSSGRLQYRKHAGKVETLPLILPLPLILTLKSIHRTEAITVLCIASTTLARRRLQYAERHSFRFRA